MLLGIILWVAVELLFARRRAEKVFRTPIHATVFRVLFANVHLTNRVDGHETHIRSTGSLNQIRGFLNLNVAHLAQVEETGRMIASNVA